MKIRLEHANLQVRDVDGMIRFVRTAFPDFRIRREGKTWQGWRWVHVGSEDCYLALNEATAEAAERWVPYSGRPGLNHLGYEVDDAEGNDWEFVEYSSDDPAQRNDYELPDLA
jgi:hypothetical protein